MKYLYSLLFFGVLILFGQTVLAQSEEDKSVEVNFNKIGKDFKKAGKTIGKESKKGFKKAKRIVKPKVKKAKKAIKKEAKEVKQSAVLIREEWLAFNGPTFVVNSVV